MRFPRLIAPLLVVALPQALLAAPAAVTIYQRDLALVRDLRTLDLRGARDTVRLGGVPERIDVASARLRPTGRARVTRLAYRYDVAGGDRLLEIGRGRRIRVALREERVVEGTLVGADGGWLQVRTADGALESVARAAVEQVRFPDPPPGLAWEPSLEAVLEGGGGRTEAELSYLTGGLSWSAEHVVVRRGEEAAEWGSTVVIENQSGRSFEVPRLGLVAGDPGGAGAGPQPVFARAMEMSLAAGKADFAEQDFGDYHLYTLDRPALLRDRETQSLVLYESRPVTARPRYRVRGGGPVLAQLEIVNRSADGLGVPLPGGRVRFYEADAGGEVRFTGETRVRHTPEGERLTLDVGTAFDLVAERRELANRRISEREREVEVEVKLRNRKKAGVTLRVEEPVAQDHEVVAHSHPFTREDSATLRFDIAVPAGREVVLRYTVRQRY